MPQGGFVTTAQGRGTSATLGEFVAMKPNPKEGCVCGSPDLTHWRPDATPLGLNGQDGIETQGSGMAATLG